MFRWGEHLEALGNGVSVLVNETHHSEPTPSFWRTFASR